MGFELVRGLAYERLYHSAELSPRLGQLLDAGMNVGADAYEAALAETAAARSGLDRFFGSCDALLAPAAAGEAPPGLGYTGNPVFNRMWTLVGVPCVTLPAIWGDSGLPTGIQLVARIGHDAPLMAAALFAERALAEAA
jgi:Asp-tRNA(Asn)/Glu-tRNA(Gln) amidotransferase A subunit family amidase